MKLSSSSGQAFVEAAIVIPIAFFLLFLLYETTLTLAAKNLIELGTFRAARTFMSTNDKNEAERAFVKSVSPIATFPKNSAFHFIEISTNKEEAVSISAVYFYKPIFPLYYFSKLLYAIIANNQISHNNLIKKATASSSSPPNNTIPICALWKLEI